MNRKTIGKVQLVLGIVLLLASVSAIFYYRFQYSGYYSRELAPMHPETSEEKYIISMMSSLNLSQYDNLQLRGTYSNILMSGRYSNLSSLRDYILISVIVLVLSVMFILQGLVNIAEVKNGR